MNLKEFKFPSASGNFGFSTLKTDPKLLKEAKADLKEAMQQCYGSYQSSEWYIKWYTWKYKKSPPAPKKKYKGIDQSQWDEYWSANWSSGGWGWRKDEW